MNAYNDLKTDNYLNILLVSPLTDSVNDQLLHLNGAEYGIVATDSPRNVRVRSETGRHFSSIPVLGRDLLRSFMPHAQNGISLAARLENFDERKISFIFGSEDRRLNRISVENFMAKAKNVTYIQGMGHISSVGHTDEVADTVEAVFSGM